LIYTFFVIEDTTFFHLPLIVFIYRFAIACSLSSTCDQSILLKLVTLSEEVSSLMLILKAHFSGSLAPIKLDLSSAATTTEAWMLTLAELIEFSDNMLQVLCIVVAEHDRELLFHFLEVNKGLKEGGDQVVLAFT
jgi:hypothetical protein